MRRTLVIMVKEPRPGRVKTRLGADMGMVPAAWWFRHQCRALIRRLRDPRWQIVLAVSPDAAGMRSRVWPADLRRVAQGRGDLGARMRAQLQGAPPGLVCVIGADIPGIDRRAVAAGFALLGGNDAVFGPSPDGGYWLVGLARRRAIPPDIFAGVKWSSPWALAQSVRSLDGHRIGYAATLSDVDTAADLAALRRV